MKYFTIYKITNNINNKYYIGKHITDNPYDNYMGSGKVIIKAIKKYGKENFTKEILYFCVDEEEMNAKEKELVVVSEETYNLNVGGYGGFDYINQYIMTNEIRSNNGKKMKKYWTDDKKEEKSQKMKRYYEKHGTEKISEALKSRYEDDDFKSNFTETMTKVNKRLDKRKNAGVKLQQKWKDPEFTKKMKNRKPRGSDGSKLKEKWNNPIWREYMLTARKSKRKKETKNETN